MDQKDLGNKYYKNGQWQKAIDAYTQALLIDPDMVAAVANRAACYIQLENWSKGLLDAEQGLLMQPPQQLKIKLLYRLAKCQSALNLDPSTALEEGLQLDPHNADFAALAQNRGVMLPTGNSVEVKIEATLPKIYSEDRAHASQQPTAKSSNTDTFLPPSLPLTYAGVSKAIRTASAAAYDWWYSINPEELLHAHKKASIEPQTLEYIWKLAKERGGTQGENLKAAARKCRGYDIASLMADI